ncbi:major facilitator superfamily MFS_1 [Thermaerobacter marianensis DSM 12885]|uniref:Major facilitator superfamily MFS_1 n=1 Tax=Thermaerobacter marianensis (strain ATCC 700841 / DSM 12885 / JCM 10246 / 7p75a) TaxID=644966 RepID=E6SJ41_THEM7|nr:MFS transporter [Thermaerobacter marianensis]ADU52065.1 major facilitator superfamily MFS_1 [Thermaerobacter marianensis DSM 12885]
MNRPQDAPPAGSPERPGPAGAGTGASGPARSGRVLGVLLIGVFLGALDIAIVGPALPSIGRSFGVDERQLAWVFTIYVLFNLIGNPLMAKLSDLRGRRPIYMLDVGLFALGSLVVAAAPSFPVLLVGRALQGFASGGIFPVASATIGETFPPERRGRALGMTGAMFGLAFLLGPVIGGVLLPFGWHWLFLVNVPLAAVVLVLSGRVLPPPRASAPAPFDWPGMALLGAGLVTLALGINRIDSQAFFPSLLSARVWPLLAVAAVALLAFRRVEAAAPEPLIRPELLGNRQLVLANALSGLSGLLQSGLVFVPSLAVAAFGVKPATASYLLGPAVLASTIGAPVAGRMLDRAGSRVVIAAGTALLAAGLLLIPAVTGSLPAFAADGVLVGFGLASLTGAPLRYVVLNEADPAHRAAAQSLLTVASNIGQMVGSAGMGAIVASHGGAVSGYEEAYVALGALTILGCLLSLGLKNREEERRTARKNRETRA